MMRRDCGTGVQDFRLCPKAVLKSVSNIYKTCKCVRVIAISNELLYVQNSRSGLKWTATETLPMTFCLCRLWNGMESVSIALVQASIRSSLPSGAWKLWEWTMSSRFFGS